MGFCFYCPSDLSLTKLKLPKTYAAKDIHFFLQEVLIMGELLIPGLH